MCVRPPEERSDKESVFVVVILTLNVAKGKDPSPLLSFWRRLQPEFSPRARIHDLYTVIARKSRQVGTTKKSLFTSVFKSSPFPIRYYHLPKRECTARGFTLSVPNGVRVTLYLVRTYKIVILSAAKNLGDGLSSPFRKACLRVAASAKAGGTKGDFVSPHRGVHSERVYPELAERGEVDIKSSYSSQTLNITLKTNNKATHARFVSLNLF